MSAQSQIPRSYNAVAKAVDMLAAEYSSHHRKRTSRHVVGASIVPSPLITRPKFATHGHAG